MTMARYGQVWPGIGGHWLPTWLPETPLAWLMFDTSNTLSVRASLEHPPVNARPQLEGAGERLPWRLAATVMADSGWGMPLLQARSESRPVNDRMHGGRSPDHARAPLATTMARPNDQTRSHGGCGSFDPVRSLRKGVIRSLPQAGPDSADSAMTQRPVGPAIGGGANGSGLAADATLAGVGRA